jgi:hypothetical protein
MKKRLVFLLIALASGSSVEARWYNPRTGEFQEIVQLVTTPDGTLSLPEKPDSQDWVLVLNLK